MRLPLTRSETLLAGACAALLLLALLGPVLPEPGHAHDFADQRTWWGIPCAMDVLSNLPFALAGLAGLWLCAQPRLALGRVERGLAGLFFFGLLTTALGSSWYHWQPDAAGLAIDRLGMSLAFAGLLGLATACQVSHRAGVALACALAGFAPAAALYCAASGNVMPWAVVQFGGMGLVVALALRPAGPGALAVGWGWVIGAYALAKLFELGDHIVFEATGHWVAGHTLKHVAAACAALPVLAALRNRQNALPVPAGTRAAIIGHA